MKHVGCLLSYIPGTVYLTYFFQNDETQEQDIEYGNFCDVRDWLEGIHEF